MFKIKYITAVLLLFLALCLPVLGNNNTQISEESVPANVRNAFNRIFVDEDPDIWYTEAVKLKGNKKERRFIAKFDTDEGQMHVRFDENGRAIGYLMTNINRDQLPDAVQSAIGTSFPGLTIESFDKIYMYANGESFFKIAVRNKSKLENIYFSESGEQYFDKEILQEFE